MKPFKIISGGQNRVDRAALEWAIENGVPHGGWCPKGRPAEDGIIPSKFHLEETESEDYSVRTRRNVQDADATVILSARKSMSGGTPQTARS
ncbi:MAG TPA: putative molybdenum carrier protein [Alphaproteobacteria bacterium]|nr:putative molybdenum carrier protein [Alphaproteobacteria bacterium]